MSTIFIFAGLPGTGKTTLSQQLAQKLRAVHLRIDTIEQGLRHLCGEQLEDEGYRLAYKIAADNLRLGMDVVADSCNPIEITRTSWEQVAHNADARFINIEVICSDRDEHRRRVESRLAGDLELRLPTWNEVTSRVYHDWSSDRIVIDTAGRSEADCVAALFRELDCS